MSEITLPYGHQCISEEDIAEVARILRGDWLTGGPAVESFERAFADYTGAKYAISFSSGTAALHGAMSAAGVGEENAIVTTPLTFAATSNSAVYMGGTPIFADISEETFCLDPEQADKAAFACGMKVKAIVPVSFAGYPADLEALRPVADMHGAIIIEDASHALGASRKGVKVGKEADMTTFSFHPVKHITTCEGGMVTTDSAEFAHHLRLFRNHGIAKDARDFGRESAGAWDNDMVILGYNYRLSDLSCALGESQLRRIDSFVARRREIAARYDAIFAEHSDLVKTPPAHPGNSYHLYAVRVEPSIRKRVFDRLRAAGIGAQVHYIPVYSHTFYHAHFPVDSSNFPVTEAVSSEVMSLSIYPSMTDEQVDFAAKTLLDAVRAERNA